MLQPVEEQAKIFSLSAIVNYYFMIHNLLIRYNRKTNSKEYVI